MYMYIYIYIYMYMYMYMYRVLHRIGSFFFQIGTFGVKNVIVRENGSRSRNSTKNVMMW